MLCSIFSLQISISKVQTFSAIFCDLLKHFSEKHLIIIVLVISSSKSESVYFLL